MNSYTGGTSDQFEYMSLTKAPSFGGKECTQGKQSLLKLNLRASAPAIGEQTVLWIGW